MTLLAPLWWLGWVISIFSGFTFADAEDFAPLSSLLLGLVTLHAMRRNPLRPASPALAAMMMMLALWPILPNMGLFFLAREFQSVRGAWPQVFVDTVGQSEVSARFDNVRSGVHYLHAFAGAWLVLFFVALSLLRARFSKVQTHVFCGLCGACAIAFVLDLGGLYAWWLD